MPDTIICPKCSYEIEVTEVFSAQLRTQLHVDDLYENGRTLWLRLHEKGGKYHEMPAHHKLAEYLDEYRIGAGLPKSRVVAKSDAPIASPI